MQLSLGKIAPEIIACQNTQLFYKMRRNNNPSFHLRQECIASQDLRS
jgi:hypothetical protein